MLNNVYRPWGALSWILDHLTTESFQFYGCISPEERCIESFKILQSKKLLTDHRFLEIIDPIDTDSHRANRANVSNELKSLIPELNIKQFPLMSPISDLYRDINEYISGAEGNVVLDISSFPKRFFFPLVKVLAVDPRVRTLVVTYTVPNSYTSRDLSENPLDWAHIPMFDNDDPDVEYELAIIGLGFVPLGLSSLFKDEFRKLDTRLFFPFPPGAPFFQRTWKFIEEMQINPKIDNKKIIRIDAMNVSQMFNTICAISGDAPILLAPYGPKPMSLAMCLYAVATKSPVYYTQPTLYDASYSFGVGTCNAYCIKLNNKLLYTVQ
jgi:hypothetical protein